MPGQTSNNLPEYQRKALGILAADRVAGMAGALRSHIMAERLARKTQDGTLGQATDMHEDELLEDMNINVGDTIYTATQKKPSKILPLILAALLGGGLGAGVAILPTILDALKQPTPEFNDSDTQYELTISSGDN